ncbi:DUF2059 domain-containing protein [Chroogloeocystis siderophila]|jgi:hypothetical protein|uniref:DUF2059 domain-containing protein n=1 Tax=Chroogloeocystis siderophila 5.2 s.c.1 TaxID=247279 RepID=A0A1U7HWN1_9CHRO|nr:DUF2059 domain-containing protein [Chroogloeocystis siderophila]OKH28003.1 hypothetical protein NIES1031_05335 [Chroogloeocystis siderophila 5.2 s.c.1]
MKLKFLYSLSILFTLSFVATPAVAQTQVSYLPSVRNRSEQNSSIDKLMTITGEKYLIRQVTLQTINTLKNQYPQVPQKFWDSFLAEMNYEEMNQRIEGIYNKYFTEEDIQGMIAFYQTPLGQKIISVLPQLAQESSKVGQQYGIEAATRAIKKLQAAGYIR